MSAPIIGAVVRVIAALLLAAVAVNAAAALAACLLQFGAMLPRGRRARTPAAVATRPPGSFVSVHVPTYDEPPDLVIATLRRLAAMTDADFEVLVIDNNTPDPAKWRPVAAAAAALGERFRFHHFDRVAGAKAGALNLALTLVDPRTTHVAIVDADYQVAPDFLSGAIAAFTAHDVDYVQFPQAYRDVGPAARGVERELGDYFACFASGTGRSGAMLPTGTLSVFTLAALRDAGGWSAATITEDAEIGVRLQAAGRRGLWLATERGTGLLPLDLAGLRQQRARWVAGNFQVLLRALRNRQLTARPRPFLALAVQLTAWVSFWLLPALALLVVALVPGLPHAATIGRVAAGTIVGSALLTAARMYLAMPTPVGDLRDWAAAVTTKLALTWTAALAWLPVLLGRTLPFRRTPKTIAAAIGSGLDAALVSSLLFATIAFVDASRQHVVEAVACALLAMVWPSSRAVDASLRSSARAAQAPA